MDDVAETTTKTMRLRYAGACRICGVALAAGVMAVYDRASKTVCCVECPGESPMPADALKEPTELSAGVAGASAQREFDRRKDKRETRIREKHPKIGGLILALSDDPQSTRAWATGANGEVVLGARLDKAVREDVTTLHDRRIPRSRANIDHLVICPTGVFVIDAKKYADKRPTLRVEGGLFSPRVSKLMVGSRDQTKLVDGVQWQMDQVRSALDAGGFGEVPVSGMLCFVDGDWPLFGGDFEIGGVKVLWPRKAVEHIGKPGALDGAAVQAVRRLLATTFAPA